MCIAIFDTALIIQRNPAVERCLSSLFIELQYVIATPAQPLGQVSDIDLLLTFDRLNKRVRVGVVRRLGGISLKTRW